MMGLAPALRSACFVGHALRLTRRADRTAMAVLTGCFVAEAGAVPAIAQTQRWLVDNVVHGGVLATTVAVLVGAVATTAVASAGTLAGPLRVYLLQRVNVALSEEVLATGAGIPTVEHLEHPEFLDRVERLRTGTSALATLPWSFAGAIAASVSLASSVVLLFGVHPLAALLALFAVPPLVTSGRAGRIARAAQDACSERRRREQRLHELCLRPGPAKELWVSGSSAEIDRRASALWEETTRVEAVGQFKATGWRIVGWGCFAAGFLAALLLSAELIGQNRATVGDAVLIVSLATSLQTQISYVVWNGNRVADAGHLVEQYHWLREYARQRPGGGATAPERIRAGISLADVGFRYPGTESDALVGVDVWLPAGSTVALVGANGAGKTTLVKLLTGMYQPTSGRITVDDLSLSSMDPVRWRERLSGVFQDFARFQFRVWETVAVGDLRRFRDREAVADAAALASAETVIARLPEGFDTQLGRLFGGVEPSVGQWQKLALARALMRPNPLLMVLDEPTGALDPQAEHELFEYFTRQALRSARERGTITLLVSHRFSTVRMADLILVVAEGRIVERGGHEELMARNGQYARLYRLQADAYREAPVSSD